MFTYRSVRFWLGCVIASVTVSAYSASNVVHWINSASQSANTVLNSGATFTTVFKGINDLQVQKLSGQVNPLFTDNYATNPGNNPTWIKTFAGNSVQGTGDGLVGHWTQLETNVPTSSGASSLQFDFALPLAPGDRMLVSDVDLSETYKIEAFVKTGNVFNPVSLTGWSYTSHTGQMGVVPDSRWATWDPASGQLVANTSSNINEPVGVLIPDQNINRIIFTKLSGGGSAGLQFISAQLPGDFNGDGKVDAADYVMWRKNNGTNNALPNDNGLGVPIGASHYLLWRQNFGNSSGSGAGTITNAVVPEPATLTLLMFAAVGWCLRRGRAA